MNYVVCAISWVACLVTGLARKKLEGESGLVSEERAYYCLWVKMNTRPI